MGSKNSLRGRSSLLKLQHDSLIRPRVLFFVIAISVCFPLNYYILLVEFVAYLYVFMRSVVRKSLVEMTTSQKGIKPCVTTVIPYITKAVQL